MTRTTTSVTSIKQDANTPDLSMRIAKSALIFTQTIHVPSESAENLHEAVRVTAAHKTISSTVGTVSEVPQHRSNPHLRQASKTITLTPINLPLNREIADTTEN